MLELIIKSFVVIYIIRLVLKHNLFIHYLKISVKFIGLDIEIKSKQKDAQSLQDKTSILFYVKFSQNKHINFITLIIDNTNFI